MSETLQSPVLSIENQFGYRINRLGFWSAVVAIVTGVITFLIPLDIPGGYAADHADRVLWLTENRGTFILGWLNQILAMLSISGIFFSVAWHIAQKYPLTAIVAAMVTLMSVLVFIIPKFMAVWTIPLLGEAIATEATGAEMADTLLRLLNVSIPFSLYTSFDYLGFWLYGVFGVLVAVPLYGASISSKVAAVTIGLFGLLYHLMLGGVLLGVIAATDVESWSLSVTVPLLIFILAIPFVFRDNLRTEQAKYGVNG